MKVESKEMLRIYKRVIKETGKYLKKARKFSQIGHIIVTLEHLKQYALNYKKHYLELKVVV